MSDQPSPDDAIDDLETLAAHEPPPHSRAVAIVAIAAVLVLAVVFVAIRMRVRGTSYDGLCSMVATPARTC